MIISRAANPFAGRIDGCRCAASSQFCLTALIMQRQRELASCSCWAVGAMPISGYEATAKWQGSAAARRAITLQAVAAGHHARIRPTASHRIRIVELDGDISVAYPSTGMRRSSN